MSAKRRRERNTSVEAEPFNAEALNDIDTVVIDLGDTLVATGRAYTRATRTFYEGLAKESRLSIDEVADGLRTLRNQEFLALPYGLNQHPGLREKFPTGDLVEQFAPLRHRTFQKFLEHIHADRDTVDFVKRLKDQGRKVVFMTSLPESAARFVIAGSGLAGLADRTYAAQDIEQDPAIETGAANGMSLNDTLAAGDLSEPMTILPPELDPREQLEFVLAQEDAKPEATLRIADNDRKDIAPANALGMRTAQMVEHRDATDRNFLKAMRTMREGTMSVFPPRVLPVAPRYEANRGEEQPNFVIRTSKQMHGAAYHVETGKPHPSKAADAGPDPVVVMPTRKGG